MPLPQHHGATLGEWLTQGLARDAAEGEGMDWHGARFRIGQLQDGRIARVAVTLAKRTR